jgi:hypothetical protein
MKCRRRAAGNDVYGRIADAVRAGRAVYRTLLIVVDGADMRRWRSAQGSGLGL